MHHTVESQAIFAEDLRAAAARKGVPLYKIAAACSIHPGRLGLILNGKIALTPRTAERIMRAVETTRP